MSREKKPVVSYAEIEHSDCDASDSEAQYAKQQQARGYVPRRRKHDAEQALAARLVQFGEVIGQVADKGQPHFLCAYLYDLAGLFSAFYEHCPILAVDDPAIRASRLKLAALTARTLSRGLALLGLTPLERM